MYITFTFTYIDTCTYSNNYTVYMSIGLRKVLSKLIRNLVHQRAVMMKDPLEIQCFPQVLLIDSLNR